MNLQKVAGVVPFQDLRNICGVDMERKTIVGKDGITRTFWEETILLDEMRMDDSEHPKMINVPKRWNNFQWAFLAYLQRQDFVQLAKTEIDSPQNIANAIEFARRNCFVNGNMSQPITMSSKLGLKSYANLLRAVSDDYSELCEKVDRIRVANKKAAINESN